MYYRVIVTNVCGTVLINLNVEADTYPEALVHAASLAAKGETDNVTITESAQSIIARAGKEGNTNG